MRFRDPRILVALIAVAAGLVVLVSSAQPGRQPLKPRAPRESLISRQVQVQGLQRVLDGARKTLAETNAQLIEIEAEIATARAELVTAQKKVAPAATTALSNDATTTEREAAKRAQKVVSIRETMLATAQNQKVLHLSVKAECEQLIGETTRQLEELAK